MPKTIFVNHKTAWEKWDSYRRMLACEVAHSVLLTTAVWSGVKRGKPVYDPKYLEVMRLLSEMREEHKAAVPFPRRNLGGKK